MKKLAITTTALLPLLLAGCGNALDTFLDIPEDEFVAESTAPVVVDLGTVSLSNVATPQEYSAEVGRPDKGSGEVGGFTASFVGTGSEVCFVLDPEGTRDDQNPDALDAGDLDDGDLDLFAGLQADYTGTPGVVMGNFDALYIDALGVEHTDNLNQCITDLQDVFGRPGAHAGRGVPERCLVETEAGVTYIIYGQTFSVPEDDGNLQFTMAVLEPQVGLGGLVSCPNVQEDTLTGDGA
jgi:hypothetical protein